MAPIETNEPINPSALPRSFIGKISVTIPLLLAMVIEAPVACTIRAASNNAKLLLKPAKSEPIKNKTMPIRNTLILPIESPSLPKKSNKPQIIIK